jgi:hypothetical protein
MSEISCVTSTTKTATTEQPSSKLDVVVARRLHQRPAEALVVEQRLDDHHAVQQPGELQHDHREGRDQRVAQRVAHHDLPKDTPFSRAVRMYCWVITSAIEARVMRAI